MSAQPSEIVEVPTTPEERRAMAIRRIKAKDEFRVHLIVFLCVNAMLALVWALTSQGKFFFWPIIPMAFWGIGLVMHGYTAYRQNVYTEDQIQQEMKGIPS